MDDVGVTEEVVQVAENFLVGSDQEYAQVVGLPVPKLVKRKGFLLLAPKGYAELV